MPDDLELLTIDYRTLFVTTSSGQIVRHNDPDRLPGPLLWLAGCEAGNVAGVHTELAEDIAAEIMSLVATEPPLYTPDACPRHLNRYISLLSHKGNPPKQSRGLIYELPHGLEYGGSPELIVSETAEGQRLYASFEEYGMPAGLRDLGFHDASHLWGPWCVALHDDDVASVAFAARLSEVGAELGIATVHPLRGRGYAAAATAGWSRLPSLQSRALFYSTDQTNVSSQRVAGRVGLRLIGCSLRLS